MRYLFYLFLCFSYSTFAVETIRIYDTLGNEPNLRRTVMKLALAPDATQYEIVNASTADAGTALANGNIDFIICGSDNLPELKKKVKKLQSAQYGVETLAVAVYLTNRVDNISLKALREVFGGKTIAWRDFNETGYMIDKAAPGEGVPGWFTFSRLLLNHQVPAKDVYACSTALEPLIIASGRHHAMTCALRALRPELSIKFLKVDGFTLDSEKYPLTLSYYLCWVKAVPDKILQELLAQ